MFQLNKRFLFFYRKKVVFRNKIFKIWKLDYYRGIKKFSNKFFEIFYLKQNLLYILYVTQNGENFIFFRCLNLIISSGEKKK